MRRNGQRRADAERDGREHGGADDDAVEKVVKRVADEHHGCSHAVHFAIMRVAVPPQHQFLENPEQNDAEEQRTQHAAR